MAARGGGMSVQEMRKVMSGFNGQMNATGAHLDSLDLQLAICLVSASKERKTTT